jgi:hypothetical protein
MYSWASASAWIAGVASNRFSHNPSGKQRHDPLSRAKSADTTPGKQTGEPLARHEDFVNVALLLPAGKRALSWSDDGTLRLSDLENQQLVGATAEPAGSTRMMRTSKKSPHRWLGACPRQSRPRCCSTRKGQKPAQAAAQQSAKGLRGSARTPVNPTTLFLLSL